METQLDSLIQRIEKEAVDEARQKAEQILAEARKQAEAILAEAHQQAEATVADARRQADQFKASGEMALRHAARDLELQLKDRIQALLDRAFRRQVGQVLEPDFLRELILRIAETWARDGQLEVEVSQADREALEALVFSGLRQELKDAITLTTGSRSARGIRVGLRGQDVYYDFTDAAMAESLREYISPRLRKALEGSDG